MSFPTFNMKPKQTVTNFQNLDLYVNLNVWVHETISEYSSNFFNQQDSPVENVKRKSKDVYFFQNSYLQNRQ